MISLIKTIELDKKKSELNIQHLEKGVYRIVDGKTEVYLEVLSVDLETKMMSIRYNHRTYELAFKNELDIVLDKMGIKRSSEILNTDIKAPMPGKVIDVVVKEGDKVPKGGPILILEAMKMENVLKAENDCSIKKVHVTSSDSVEKNQVLVELDAI
ncbi:MAG: biotin/lipoyl-binding protein [Crocinitomicaceae bacterium]|nr:biotin/lipoyl-binding protein [Crocinitomicaceae bacterium]